MTEIEILINKNKNLVYQVINDLKYIPRGVDQEELFQIGLISLWKAIESYDKTDSYAMSTHCYQTIKSDIIDELRKHEAKKRQEVIISGKPYMDSFEDEVIGMEIITEINKYISDKSTNILVDKYMNKLSMKEISEKYNMTERGILKNITRSIKTLRNKLEWEV